MAARCFKRGTPQIYLIFCSNFVCNFINNLINKINIHQVSEINKDFSNNSDVVAIVYHTFFNFKIADCYKENKIKRQYR